jgi:hypothetical protein
MNIYKDILKSLESLDCCGEDKLESTEETQELKQNPCLDGHEMLGMKEEDGRQVPNCVPIEEKK